MPALKSLLSHILPPWPLPTRLLLTLTAALMPLGIVAVILAGRAYHELRSEQMRHSINKAAIMAGQIDAVLRENLQLLGFVWTGMTRYKPLQEHCAGTARELATYSALLQDISIIDDKGHAICGTPAPDIAARARRAGQGVASHMRGGQLPFHLYIDSRGDLFMTLAGPARQRQSINLLILGRINNKLLSDRLAANRGASEAYQLVVDGRIIVTVPAEPAGAISTLLNDSLPVGGGAARLHYRIPPLAVLPSQMLLVSLPILMWLTALAIGWLVVRHIAVRPLTIMRHRVERLASGEDAIVPPMPQDTPRLGSLEMQQLADAFDTMASRIVAHELAQAQALETQAQLVREVHHRVKNNLQVIASLLSIYARGATAPEAADAYAAIRLRINALTIVHRWLFEDSDNGRVPLRPLMQDLCLSIMQAVQERYDSDFVIKHEVASLHVAQDHAVSLAFLVTEIAAVAVENQPPGPVKIQLDIKPHDGMGHLVMATPRFREGYALDAEQMTAAARIANGMARQLRSRLRYNATLGEYNIDFNII